MLHRLYQYLEKHPEGVIPTVRLSLTMPKGCRQVLKFLEIEQRERQIIPSIRSLHNLTPAT